MEKELLDLTHNIIYENDFSIFRMITSQKRITTTIMVATRYEKNVNCSSNDIIKIFDYVLNWVIGPYFVV